MGRLDVWAAILISLSAVIAVTCVIAYAKTTGGAWRDTELGQHLMAFMLVIALVLITSTVRVWIVYNDGTEPGWLHAVRIVTFSLVPVVLAWRLRIILWADNESHDDRRDVLR